MTHFGQIPTEIICRFGELSKTQIRVLGFLYASLNRTTKQCNPSRKTISEQTGLAESHISLAIKILDRDGWLCEMAEGGFMLTIPESRDEISYRIGKTEVTESVRKVTESVSESYGIGKRLNKDMNIQGTYKEHIEIEQATEGKWEYPMRDLITAFPNVQFQPGQIGIIESRVTTSEIDRAAWAAAIDKYVLNYDPALRQYVPTKIGNLLGVFQDEKSKIERSKNGANKTVNFREQRTSEAINDRNTIADIRQRVAARNAGLLGTGAIDSSGQL